MTKRHRYIFCIENFQHGGINKALENLISLIDHKLVDVKIFVVNQEEGPYETLFSPYLAYQRDSFLINCCTNYQKASGLRKYYLMGFKTINKLLGKCRLNPFKMRLSYWANKITHDKYDCVIAFAEGYITEFVARIKGNKVAWIHIDYLRYLEYVNNRNERHIYSAYDRIAIPSNFSKESFAQIFTNLTSRIEVIPNLINIDNVLSAARNFKLLDSRFICDGFTIISVGRICHEKGFVKIPQIASILREKEIKFKWYVIGNGSGIETKHLTDEIKRCGASDYVITLGRQDNPYPYIAQSDLLVSTSISETFSYVVFEAKSLGVPVICNDFGTAPEVVKEGEGLIVPIEQMADTIAHLYHNPEQLAQLKANLKNYSYNNKIILDKIYALIEH